MEAEGVNQVQLVELMREAGEPISKGHMCDILKGSERCSLRKALVLSHITGGAVPVEAIKEWPRIRKFRVVRVSA